LNQIKKAVLLDRRRFETVGFRRFCTSGPQHCVDVSLLRQKDITREIHSEPQFAASLLLLYVRKEAVSKLECFLENNTEPWSPPGIPG
jgi:hypothetical protein